MKLSVSTSRSSIVAKSVNDKENYLITLNSLKKNNLISSLLKNKEKELVSLIESKIKCKSIDIIQLFQIANYQKHWNSYI